MGRGEYLAEKLIELDIDVSTTYTSEGITLGEMARLSIQVVLTNTDVSGDLTFEASNNNTNWCPLSFIDGSGVKQTVLPVTAGEDVNELLDFSNLGVGYVRVKFENDSGDEGTMSIWAIRKRV